MALITIKKESFKKEVLDEKGFVLVDFFAEWCGPCKMTAPIIEQLADEKKDIKFVKVNVDENPELSSQYQVFSIPTFIFFKNGKVVSQFVGVHSKEGFLQEIERAISA